jgi:glycosyltransferase involved in cell wall biosynthesis
MHIGVVVPAYNAAAWIADAIASVLAQTHRDWSLVVVDDGSSDGTGAVAASFCDARIRLIMQANAGVSVARNRGVVELVRTSLPLQLREGGGGRVDAVLFLDADDWLAPDALSRLNAALDASPDATAASGPCTFTGGGTVRIPPSGDILPCLLVRNLFANCGQLLFRTDAIDTAGGFMPGIAYGEDWEFCIRVAQQGPFASAPGKQPVLFVRRHAEGAYRRLAQCPDAFAPCMNAIFTNSALADRFGVRELAAIRRRTEAENTWIIGREQVRHGHRANGLGLLCRSVRDHPTLRRAILLAAAHLLHLLPASWRGSLRPYGD